MGREDVWRDWECVCSEGGTRERMCGEIVCSEGEMRERMCGEIESGYVRREE